MFALEEPQADVTVHARLRCDEERIERFAQWRKPPRTLHCVDVRARRRRGELLKVWRRRHADELLMGSVEQHRGRGIAQQSRSARVADTVCRRKRAEADYQFEE